VCLKQTWVHNKMAITTYQVRSVAMPCKSILTSSNINDWYIDHNLVSLNTKAARLVADIVASVKEKSRVRQHAEQRSWARLNNALQNEIERDKFRTSQRSSSSTIKVVWTSDESYFRDSSLSQRPPRSRPGIHLSLAPSSKSDGLPRSISLNTAKRIYPEIYNPPTWSLEDYYEVEPFEAFCIDADTKLASCSRPRISDTDRHWPKNCPVDYFIQCAIARRKVSPLPPPPFSRSLATKLLLPRYRLILSKLKQHSPDPFEVVKGPFQSWAPWANEFRRGKPIKADKLSFRNDDNLPGEVRSAQQVLFADFMFPLPLPRPDAHFTFHNHGMALFAPNPLNNRKPILTREGFTKLFSSPIPSDISNMSPDYTFGCLNGLSMLARLGVHFSEFVVDPGDANTTLYTARLLLNPNFDDIGAYLASLRIPFYTVPCGPPIEGDSQIIFSPGGFDPTFATILLDASRSVGWIQEYICGGWATPERYEVLHNYECEMFSPATLKTIKYPSPYSLHYPGVHLNPDAWVVFARSRILYTLDSPAPDLRDYENYASLIHFPPRGPDPKEPFQCFTSFPTDLQCVMLPQPASLPLPRPLFKYGPGYKAWLIKYDIPRCHLVIEVCEAITTDTTRHNQLIIEYVLRHVQHVQSVTSHPLDTPDELEDEVSSITPAMDISFPITPVTFIAGLAAYVGIKQIRKIKAAWRRAAPAVNSAVHSLEGVSHIVDKVSTYLRFIPLISLIAFAIWKAPASREFALSFLKMAVPVALFAASVQLFDEFLRAPQTQSTTLHNTISHAADIPFLGVGKVIAGVLIFLTIGRAGKGWVKDVSFAGGNFDRNSTSWSKLSDWTVNIVETVMNFIRHRLGLESISLRARRHVELYAWVTAVKELAVSTEAGQKGMLQGSDLTHLRHLHECSKHFDLMYREDKDMCRIVRETTTITRNLCNDNAAALAGAGGARPEPVCCILRGPAGCGKSYAMRYLANAVAALTVSEERFEELKGDMSRESFTRGNSEYFNGYCGQTSYMKDDWGQSTVVAGDPNNDYLDTIHMVNPWVMPLNFADLTNKGKNFFTSSFVFLTTNVLDIPAQARTCCVDSSAVTRRLHFAYDILPKPNWALEGSHGTAVDTERVRRHLEEKGCYPDAWNLVKFDPTKSSNYAIHPDPNTTICIEQLPVLMASKLHFNRDIETTTKRSLVPSAELFYSFRNNIPKWDPTIPRALTPHPSRPLPVTLASTPPIAINPAMGWPFSGPKACLVPEAIDEEPELTLDLDGDSVLVHDLEPEITPDKSTYPPLFTKENLTQFERDRSKKAKPSRFPQLDVIRKYLACRIIAEKRLASKFSWARLFVTIFFIISGAALIRLAFKGIHHIFRQLFPSKGEKSEHPIQPKAFKALSRIPEADQAKLTSVLHLLDPNDFDVNDKGKPVPTERALVNALAKFKAIAPASNIDKTVPTFINNDASRLAGLRNIVNASDINSTDIAAAMKKNTYRFFLEGPHGSKCSGYLTMVAGHIGIYPHHFNRFIRAGIERGTLSPQTEILLENVFKPNLSYTYPVKRFLSFRHHFEPDHDLAFVRLDDMHSCKDVSSFFLQQDILEKLDHALMRIEVHRPNGSPAGQAAHYTSTARKITYSLLQQTPGEDDSDLRTSYCLDATTSVGDCGAQAFLANAPWSGCAKLVGILVGISPGKTYTNVISREMITKAFTALDAIMDAPNALSISGVALTDEETSHITTAMAPLRPTVTYDNPPEPLEGPFCPLARSAPHIHRAPSHASLAHPSRMPGGPKTVSLPGSLPSNPMVRQSTLWQRPSQPTPLQSAHLMTRNCLSADGSPGAGLPRYLPTHPVATLHSKKLVKETLSSNMCAPSLAASPPGTPITPSPSGTRPISSAQATNTISHVLKPWNSSEMSQLLLSAQNSASVACTSLPTSSRMSCALPQRSPKAKLVSSRPPPSATPSPGGCILERGWTPPKLTASTQELLLALTTTPSGPGSLKSCAPTAQMSSPVISSPGMAPCSLVSTALSATSSMIGTTMGLRTAASEKSCGKKSPSAATLAVLRARSRPYTNGLKTLLVDIPPHHSSTLLLTSSCGPLCGMTWAERLSRTASGTSSMCSLTETTISSTSIPPSNTSSTCKPSRTPSCNMAWSTLTRTSRPTHPPSPSASSSALSSSGASDTMPMRVRGSALGLPHSPLKPFSSSHTGPIPPLALKPLSGMVSRTPSPSSRCTSPNSGRTTGRSSPVPAGIDSHTLHYSTLAKHISVLCSMPLRRRAD
jgi:hypothetical protein